MNVWWWWTPHPFAVAALVGVLLCVCASGAWRKG